MPQNDAFVFEGARPISAPMLHLLEQLKKIAATDATVLIQGETGTGKELVARAIHENSSRKVGSLITRNSGTGTEHLQESALFGHEKGAFTGATEMKKGFFELADTGTIFFDEVGDMPPSMQVKLLRVLETGLLQRVGGSNDIKVDVRVIAATHRPLEHMPDDQFRRDLYYRLEVVKIMVPPLRNRKEDIPGIVAHLLLNSKVKKNAKESVCTKDALEMLCDYDWPGNVRQLRNYLDRVLTDCKSNTIGPDCLKETGWPPGQQSTTVLWNESNCLHKETATQQILNRFIIELNAALCAIGRTDEVSSNFLDPSRRAALVAYGLPYNKTDASRHFPGTREVATWLRRSLEAYPAAGLLLKETLSDPVLRWLTSVQDGKKNSILATWLRTDSPSMELANECIVKQPLSAHSSEVVLSAKTTVVNFGMDEFLVGDINNFLRQQTVKAIHAVDVVGPTAWSNSVTYRYLAPQLYAYVTQKGSPAGCLFVMNAINTAVQNAKSPRSSYTHKTTSSVSALAGLASSTRVPTSFCMSRLLLWTKEELLSTDGASVISIHEDFRIPLFFIEVNQAHQNRSIDFITFDFVDRFHVFYGRREEGFRTIPSTYEIPGLGDPITQYEKLLSNENILLAIDARRIYGG